MLFFQYFTTLAQHIQTFSTLLPGKDVFIVGGAIRDLLLGIHQDPGDIDLTLAGNPQDIREDMDYKETTMSRFKTDKFGTMTLIPKNEQGPRTTSEGYSLQYEITPLRTEGNYDDFRHPGEIQRSDNLLSDAQRRDFTINCIYYHYTQFPTTEISPQDPLPFQQDKLSTILSQTGSCYLANEQVLILQSHQQIASLFPSGKLDTAMLQQLLAELPRYQTQTKELIANDWGIHILLDPHQGIQDLIQRRIRCVGDPDKRFTEDALRILRGVRFPNLLNQRIPGKDIQNNSFDYEKSTRTSMEQHAPLVQHLAKERIYQELKKVFSGNNPFGYVSLLDELGLVQHLFPAVSACKNNTQPTRYHPFDTYTHTLLTLHAVQQLTADFLVKFAMLYHDVGKPEQYAYVEQQKHLGDEIDRSSYTHHTEIGVNLVQHDMQQLGFSKKEQEETCRYVRRHHRPGEILDSKKENRVKKLRALISEAGKTWVLNLIDIAIADRQGQLNPLQDPAVSQLYEMKQQVEDIFAQEGRFTPKQLAINGSDLMQHYTLNPGPQIGKILQQLFDRALTDVANRNNKDLLLAQAKSLLS